MGGRDGWDQNNISNFFAKKCGCSNIKLKYCFKWWQSIMLKRKNKEIDIKTKRKIRENPLPLMRLEPVTAWSNKGPNCLHRVLISRRYQQAKS